MKDIKTGIIYYREKVWPLQKDALQQLAREGQRPERVVISCSDSRVKITEVTQADAGDLFIIRNAGNIVPPYGEFVGGVTASIEYAVEVLPIKEIIICGHTMCGAIQAMLYPDLMQHLPAVKQWLGYASEAPIRAMKRKPDADAPKLLRATIADNVLLQLEHLSTFPCVQKRVAAGTLKLIGWVLEIETGEVWEHSAIQNAWAPIR